MARTPTKRDERRKKLLEAAKMFNDDPAKNRQGRLRAVVLGDRITVHRVYED